MVMMIACLNIRKKHVSPHCWQRISATITPRELSNLNGIKHSSIVAIDYRAIKHSSLSRAHANTHTYFHNGNVIYRVVLRRQPSRGIYKGFLNKTASISHILLRGWRIRCQHAATSASCLTLYSTLLVSLDSVGCCNATCSNWNASNVRGRTGLHLHFLPSSLFQLTLFLQQQNNDAPFYLNTFTYDIL